jgi:hypothetical protein
MNSRQPASLSLTDPGRRRLLWSLVSLGLSTGIGRAEKPPGTAYRFQTPECEVRLTVEFFERVLSDGFHFNDQVANRNFCFSAVGDVDQDCLSRFSGSMAIATYHFRTRHHQHKPLLLREKVVTIDHDRRITPRPIFEKTLPLEKGIASDIQVFGYNPDDPSSGTEPIALWCLLRQNLYLNDHAEPFLIVHWKHTFDSITVVDVIPGDETQLLGD